ncbi:hypothetical protein ACQ4M4_09835 [Leptolyngbya sp. AN02str]|uniref:hypothetical protein n=1 Tax=Leptolyngbya sp. AN02str TaxID=3423363 RepID=UPI003D31062B
MMQPLSSGPGVPLEDLVCAVLDSRQISHSDEYRLIVSLTAYHTVSDDVLATIERIFYGLRHGLLSLVD